MAHGLNAVTTLLRGPSIYIRFMAGPVVESTLARNRQHGKLLCHLLKTGISLPIVSIVITIDFELYDQKHVFSQSE